MHLSLNPSVRYLAVYCSREKNSGLHTFLCSSFVVEITFFFPEGMLWVLIFCSQSEPIYPLKNESRTKQSAFFLPYWIQLKKIYKLDQCLKNNNCFNLCWKAWPGDLFVSERHGWLTRHTWCYETQKSHTKRFLFLKCILPWNWFGLSVVGSQTVHAAVWK